MVMNEHIESKQNAISSWYPTVSFFPKENTKQYVKLCQNLHQK